MIREKVNVESKVEEARYATISRRIGIIARMGSWEEKRAIMSNKKNLGDERIFIQDDWDVEEKEVQGRLRVIAGWLRKFGKEAQVSYRKIRIENRWFRWEQIERSEHKGIMERLEKTFLADREKEDAVTERGDKQGEKKGEEEETETK